MSPILNSMRYCLPDSSSIKTNVIHLVYRLYREHHQGIHLLTLSSHLEFLMSNSPPQVSFIIYSMTDLIMLFPRPFFNSVGGSMSGFVIYEGRSPLLP